MSKGIIHHRVNRPGRGAMVGLELSKPELRVLSRALVLFWSEPEIPTERDRKMAVRLWEQIRPEINGSQGHD